MKKIIGLSAALCLLISVMAGLGAFAADTTYYDINFDSWDIDAGITAETEEPDTVFYNATGYNWTFEAISGKSKVSTVTWAEENKVLKIEGTKRSESTSASDSISTLKIVVPYASNNDTADNSYSAATYDNDLLVAEYDVYIESSETDPIDTVENASQFNYSVFAEYGYNDIVHIKKTATVKPYSRKFTTIAENADGSIKTESSEQYAMYDEGMAFNTWYRLKWVIDADCGVAYNNGTKDYPTLVKTATLYTTNLSTGVTKIQTTYIPTARWAGETLLLGGNTRSASTNNTMTGVYYVDNFKLYRQNKFAVASYDDGATNVSIDKDSVSFTMNGAVKADSLAGITLTGGGNTVDITPNIDADGKTVVVTINEELDYGTTYTLDFSSVKREDGTAIELGATSLSFATEAAPALYISERNIYSGYDTFVLDADEIGNGLYTIAAKVKNSVSEAKSATAIVAAYNANGKLIETAYVSKSIAAGAEETLAAGMTIPAELAGGTVKVFLWNGIGSMQPYIKPITEAIASAN